MINKDSILSIEKAEELISDYIKYVKAEPKDVTIDIYGGEITLLPEITQDGEYLIRLYKMTCKYADHINLISNNSKFEEISKVYESLNDTEASKFSCSASLFNKERHDWKWDIERFPMMNPLPKSILTVVTKDIIKTPCKKLLDMADSTGAESISFLQYTPSITNQYQDISNLEYATKIQQLIMTYMAGDYKIRLANLDRLEDCLSKKYTPVNDNIVFILPTGLYAALGYDSHINEMFIGFTSLIELSHYNKTIFDIYTMQCHSCEFYGHCAADHIKDHFKGDECCGFKNLLSWYKNNLPKDDE